MTIDKQRVNLTFIFLVGIILFNQDVIARNKKLADSLMTILETKDLEQDERLVILKELAVAVPAPDDKIHFSNVLLKEALQADSMYYACFAEHQLGLAYRLKGDLSKSLAFFSESAVKCLNYDYSGLLASNYGEMANTYSSSGDIHNSLSYNRKAIQLLKNTKYLRELGAMLVNVAYDYYTLEKFDSALLYYNEVEPLYDSIGSKRIFAYVIGNKALVKWKLGDVQEAIHDLREAIEQLQYYGDHYGIADYFNQLGNIYYEQNDYESAVDNLSKGVRMAKAIDLKEQVRDASQLLSKIYDELDQTDSAYYYLNQYLAMRDSITNEQTIQELANQKADYEIGQKQKEVDELAARERRQETIIIAIIVLSVMMLVAGYGYLRIRNRKRIERQNIAQRMAELKALKAQINPHFLFNALNSIHAFILDGKQEVAEEYVVKYGKLTRKILNHANELAVPLEEELEAIQLYIELEQIRVKGGFEFTVELGVNVDRWNTNVPSMVIQPFLENAIWHGISKMDGHGEIRLKIGATDDFIEIVITDNGEGYDTSKPLANSSKGVSLVKERLELLRDSSGATSALEIKSEVGEGTKVTLRYPNDLGF